MIGVPLLALAVVFWAFSTVILLRQNLRLKKKVLRLAKEVEIQGSKLNYQKEQFSDSVNYFSSAVIIIMEMLQEIDRALKTEEGDLSEKILQIIFEKAKNLLRPERCILFKVDTEKETCSCLYSFGYKDEQLRSLSPSLDAIIAFWDGLL